MTKQKTSLNKYFKNFPDYRVNRNKKMNYRILLF